MPNSKINTKRIILAVCIILVGGAVGSMLFQLFIFPSILQNSYFAQFQFIKNFKEGKIIINNREEYLITQETALEKATEKVDKSVVAIQIETGSGTTYSPGVIATSDGMIITLSSLIPSGADIKIFAQGEDGIVSLLAEKPEVLKRDAKNNLVLLKIEGVNLKTCGFCSAEEVKLGERVFLMGIVSEKLEWIVNEGIIKSFNEDLIKTNIFESSVLKGSPLFNIKGNLVGLNTIDSQGKVIAIPIQKIKDFAGF